uniref:PGF-CTERM archaeal protein-sorting signal domain-containing protein n=1 Tax=Candidatus Methanogaster sp. ANME-2c ERB4 TaxID=2759911 RepID=A0A7G9Y1L0_9EURY|nr:hypothetical protein FJLPHLKL_00003 [Methanosarcinales archaeon ANME-2c ERB4]
MTSSRATLLIFLWYIHYNIQPLYALFSFTKKYTASPHPKGHFLLANYSPNFSQKFDQKLPSGLDASFYSKTSHKRSTKKQPPPGGQFLLDFLWYVHHSVQPLYALFSFTKKYTASSHPKGHFLLANSSPNSSPNFSQKFDQKLTSNLGGHFLRYVHDSVQSLYALFSFTKKYTTNPTRRAVFTRFFVKKSFLMILVAAVLVQVAASEDIVCTDATLVWGERVAIEGYVFEVADFSVGRASEIRLGESVWALVTVYENDSVVWREVFSTNETAIDYAYNANESSYTFDLNCTGTYLENGTDRIRVHASKIVIGSNPPIQSITVQACIIPPIELISFSEWMNNTFSVIKSASKEVYVREQAFVELRITNLSMADSVEVTDSITDEFVVDPDRDLYWDYSRDTYRYSVTPLVPGVHMLPAANVSVWCEGRRINITSDTPEVTVQGPYVTVTKTAEHADGVVNVTVSACNEGTHAAMVYVFGSLPDGVELVGGTLNWSMVLNPSVTEYTSEYENVYTVKINETVTLPRTVVYYQTARQVDLARDYKPAATYELEKYINPKFYSARARSSEILIRYGADVDAAPDNAIADAVDGAAADASDGVPDEAPGDTSGETDESQPATDGNENDEEGEEEENEEENGLMDKIKAMPGFTSIFAIIGLLSGYLILRFGSQNS